MSKKDLLQFIPFTAAFLIFCGITRLIFFYSLFNFDITNFLELSEILTSFSSIIFKFQTTIETTIYYDYISIIIIELFLFSTFEKYILKNKFYLKKGVNILNFIGICFIIVNEFVEFLIEHDESFLITSHICLFLLFANIGCLLLLIFVSNDMRFIISRLLICYVIFFLFVMRDAYSEAINIVINQQIVTLRIKPELGIVTGNSFLYLGQTKNFIFIYDRKKKLTRVYKMDNIIELSYQDIDDYIKYNLSHTK